MGADVVAVDATCARIMGLDPGRIEYIRLASDFLGHADAGRIRQCGERLERFRTTFDVIEAHRGFRQAGR
jgi:uncharacterized protein (DUF362 family)